MNKSVILGSECDEKLSEKIKLTLRGLNAVLLKKDFFVAGSQDIEKQSFLINKHNILIEIETYTGISISGEEVAVNMFLSAFNEA